MELECDMRVVHKTEPRHPMVGVECCNITLCAATIAAPSCPVLPTWPSRVL